MPHTENANTPENAQRINKAIAHTIVHVAVGKRALQWFKQYQYPGLENSSYSISKAYARNILAGFDVDLDALLNKADEPNPGDGLEIKCHSVQTVAIADMFTFEFIGDGCLLPERVKKAIFEDLCKSIETHVPRKGVNQ